MSHRPDAKTDAGRRRWHFSGDGDGGVASLGTGDPFASKANRKLTARTFRNSLGLTYAED